MNLKELLEKFNTKRENALTVDELYLLEAKGYIEHFIVEPEDGKNITAQSYKLTPTGRRFLFSK